MFKEFERESIQKKEVPTSGMIVLDYESSDEEEKFISSNYYKPSNKQTVNLLGRTLVVKSIQERPLDNSNLFETP